METRKLLVLLVYTLISLKFTFGQSNTPCTSGSISAPSIAVGASCSFTSGTTAGATAQTNAANGGTPSCGMMGPDVWYQFTAPASGSVLIQTQTGSITDGVMALYSGTCGSFTEIDCSDDVNGLMPEISSVSLTPGATYLIRFWEYGGGTGTFDLCVTAVASPTGNTTCSVQTPICSGSPITFTANTGGADASTVNPGNSYGCLITSPNPSWYYLEIATPGTLTVDITAGSDVDFAIWGPFASVATANAACNTYGAPSDCSYSSAAVEQVNISGTLVGQVYVLLVTNYANTVQNISVTNAGGTATTNCAIVPLPVGFSAWDAVSAGNEIRLAWTTQNETNNDYFAVQRSGDGLVWETLGLIEGAGTTSQAQNYSFTDQSPIEGINYYRLMQVDNNGQYEFSQIRSVNYSSSTKYQISPNPTKAYAFVNQNGHIKITSVELIDQVGRVQQVPFDYLEGGVNVDCRAVSHGTYFIRCTDELGKASSSLLVIE